jgi:alpha-galactosidase
LGAGSSVFTMRLVGDILKEDTIKKGHIALVDLDEKLLRETEEAVKELVAFSGQEFEVTAHIDYKEALPGTDYLFNTIATGGYERWKSDIEVSTKHGVLQSVGDTIGPGGIIRALRTIPVILDVAKTMEEICPDAWIINYANPEGAICLALQKYTKIKNFGLCHGTPDMAKQLAEEVFKVPIERFTYRAAGINHLTWFTDMKIDGKDVYPKLHDKLKESGFDKKEPISKQLYDIYGLYPAPGDRHVGEFFPYYMKEEVLMEQDYEWKNNDFKVVDGWREEARVLFDEVRTKKEGYEEFLKGSGETATYFIRSLATGDISDEMVNVINNGYIDNVSSGIIVELPTYIDEFGLHPQKIGKLPDAIAAQCDRLGREYLLMVEAAATCNYELARQAMFLDPLVSNCKYPELLLKDLIRANLDLLPEAWEKHC